MADDLQDQINALLDSAIQGALEQPKEERLGMSHAQRARRLGVVLMALAAIVSLIPVVSTQDRATVLAEFLLGVVLLLSGWCFIHTFVRPLQSVMAGDLRDNLRLLMTEVTTMRLAAAVERRFVGVSLLLLGTFCLVAVALPLPSLYRWPAVTLLWWVFTTLSLAVGVCHFVAASSTEQLTQAWLRGLRHQMQARRKSHIRRVK